MRVAHLIHGLEPGGAEALLVGRWRDVLHTHLKHAGLVGAVAARLSIARATITVSDAQRRWYLGAFPSADPRRLITVRNGVVVQVAGPVVATGPARRAALGAAARRRFTGGFDSAAWAGRLTEVYDRVLRGAEPRPRPLPVPDRAVPPAERP